MALQSLKLKKIDQPVFVTLEWYVSSKHDPDNIRVGVKYIFDGLIQSGKLQNDNQKWILGFKGDYFYRVNKGEEKVIVTFETG